MFSRRLCTFVLFSNLCLLCTPLSFAQNQYQNNTFLTPDKQQAALSKLKAFNSWPENKAAERFNAWQDLIEKYKNSHELDKVKAANDFLGLAKFQVSRNQIVNMNNNHHASNAIGIYRTDADMWGSADDWATPVEYVGYSAGDCEDFAFAKMFTLQAMGVPAERMYMAMVNFNPRAENPNARQAPEGHMVLFYYPENTSANNRDNPYVLDINDQRLLKLSERAALEDAVLRDKNGKQTIASIIFNANKLYALQMDRSDNTRRVNDALSATYAGKAYLLMIAGFQKGVQYIKGVRILADTTNFRKRPS
jgi:predicted transglutaminase-like cysteine proteinase